MKTVLNIGKLGGLTISIHWTFSLLIIWIVFINFVAGFRMEQLLWSLLLFLGLLISICAHEAGHALVAKYFSIRASGIIFLPIGAVASIPNLPRKPGQEILITLAGVAVNLAIAALLLPFTQPYRAYWSDPENIGVVNGGNFLFQLQVVNLSLGLFNLIPAFPMDGGRILRIILALRLNIVKATRIAAIVGQGIACMLIIWGVGVINLLLIMTGVFILFAARSEEYYLQLKNMAQGLKLRDVLMHDYNSLEGNASMMEVSSILMVNHSHHFLVMQEGRAAGTINRMEIVKAIAEMKYDVQVQDLMKRNLDCLDANSNVEDLIEKLAGKEEKLYPVMEQNHFTGVVNFRQIIEYLLIHSAPGNEYRKIKSLAGHF